MNRQKRWLYGLLLILVLLGCTVGWSFSDMIDDEAHHAGATQQDLDCLRKGLGCGAIERQPDPPVGSETKGMEEVHIDLVARHDIEEWTPPTLPPLRDPSVPCPDKYLTVNTHTWGRHHNQLQSVVHGILMAHLLNRTFVLGHFRHAKAWHDVRSFYSFEELGRYFCIKDAASAQLLHERSVGCFGQDIHDMPLGKQNHLKCDPKALFPKSFPIPGFKTTIETAIPKLRAAQQRLINLSGELAFFLRPGLRFMAMGYGLLRPSKEVQEEVDRFSKATYGEGQDYIAIHLRYREGTCSAEIETDFVKNFNISPKLLGELHAQCKVNFTYTSVTLRNVLGISSTGDPNILPYPAFLASDHQNKAAEMDLLTKGAVFYSGKYHTEEIGGLHGLATDYFLLRKGSVFIGNSASSVSQTRGYAMLADDHSISQSDSMRLRRWFIVAVLLLLVWVCQTALYGNTVRGEEAVSSTVVVVSASYEYKELLLNWLVAAESSKSEGETFRVKVLCLDEKMRRWLSALGGSCEGSFTTGNLADLWELRLGLVAQYFHDTTVKMVLLSDLDAIWVKSPVQEVRSLKADIVAQRGSYPNKLFKKWGATACMGFIAFKTTEGTLQLLQSALENIKETRDDQVALNTALATLGVRWEGLLTYTNSSVMAYGTASLSQLTVALLPHSTYPRVCPTPLGDVVVAHCFDRGVGKKNAVLKSNKAKERQLWYLSDNWRQADVILPFEQYLRSLKRL